MGSEMCIRDSIQGEVTGLSREGAEDEIIEKSKYLQLKSAGATLWFIASHFGNREEVFLQQVSVDYKIEMKRPYYQYDLYNRTVDHIRLYKLVPVE